ncbi:MAG: calcium-binding protein [Paracoccus sp. (in: a-proteobacteria)]
MDHNSNTHHDMPDDDATGSVVIHINSAGAGENTAWGGGSDDTFHGITNGHPSDQIHIFGHGGNDTFHMDHGISGSSHIQHGFHVFGGEGRDVFKFENLNAMRGTVVGRLDDFQSSDDQIFINDERLDLSNPEAIKDFRVQTVEYLDQQWLEIRNVHGGRAFYALEGARQAEQDDGSFDDEDHFLRWDTNLPDNLPQVIYQDPINFLPAEVYESYKGEETVTLQGNTTSHTYTGSDAAEEITANRGGDHLKGGGGDDYIDGFMGADTINGGAGDDRLQGGKGFDSVNGGAGDDTISSGSDNDTVYGGAGDDVIYGGSEDDYLSGDGGNDYLFGGRGADTLLGGTGRDTLVARDDDSILNGGDGDDQLILDGRNLFAEGGDGEDLFEVAAGTTTTISDFDAAHDRINLGEFFEDEEDLLNFVTEIRNPDDNEVMDLAIQIPGHGEIILQGAGYLAKNPGVIAQEWKEGLHEDDPGIPSVDPVQPDMEPESEPEEYNEDSGSAGDSGGGDMGGLLAALLGGLLLAIGGSSGGGFF